MNAACVLAFSTAVAALYAWGFVAARRRGRRIASWRGACFFGGVSIGGIAVSAFDRFAETSLTWHMLQHLLLLEVAVPLAVLGSPHRVALGSLPPRAARALGRILESGPVRALAHPAIAWLQFEALLFVTHLSPWYEAALEGSAAHGAMHAAYLLSAAIFWSALLAPAPAPRAAAHPVRALMAFLAMPIGAFLGFVLYASAHVWYAHYAPAPDALADQRTAGMIMWIAGGVPLFVTLLWLIADWGKRERRLGAISDARFAREGR